jgi:hypothetical protein
VVYRVVQGFFLGGIHLKKRFGIADSQVDALFRLKNERNIMHSLRPVYLGVLPLCPVISFFMQAQRPCMLSAETG